jgi:hypothetical protein
MRAFLFRNARITLVNKSYELDKFCLCLNIIPHSQFLHLL